MIGIKQTIQTRLILFTGTIIALFILFFILQYNNYVFTKRTLAYHENINQTKIVPSKLQGLHYLFINRDILENKFYANGVSPSVDSSIMILTAYKKSLESLVETDYIPINSRTQKMLTSLRNESDNLIQKYMSLTKEILERGLYLTGKSGEWIRFGSYLQDLAGSYNNVSLVRTVSEMNNILDEYQYNKTNDRIRQLLEKINNLKVQLLAKSGPNAISIDEASRLKFSKELDTFASLALDIQKTDTKIGLLNGEGDLGEMGLHLGMLLDK